MANATVVCTDKTGTLTQNEMSVVAGSVGVHVKFVKNLQENLSRSNADEADGKKKRKHADDFSIEQNDLNNVLSPALQHLFNEGIAVNSTAFEDANRETGKVEFVGSKTETALLNFAKDLGWTPYQETRNNAQIVQMLPFASERKYMGVLIRHNDKYRVYFKGASEILTNICTRYIVVNQPGQGSSGSEHDSVETREIDGLSKENIANTIIFYANQMLRTIALCYKEVDVWPPKGTSGQEEIPLSDLAHDLTLVGIVGIEDPLRPGVRDAVADCAHAGVTIKMCTGDNALTARSIASQCGIYSAGGIIMEGPVFRKLTEEERDEVVPYLQVLARSSPEDKKILVETLKRQGQVVGVTGDGTNDGPALKTANVGFSMGIAGTEVAKEASDIILMDDNFASIVSAIIWGRCVNDSVRKFLQFQISVNITAVLITFITAVSSEEMTSVLTAVQLLWINIIMDTFAALALATDRATRSLLNRMPDAKTAPLFTFDMSKMIIGQAIYQTIVVLVFHFVGPIIYGLGDNDTKGHNELKATVFNIFVFCQIFNSINCRRIDNKYNIFEGMSKNWYFMAITTLGTYS
jgi:Ca2+-transporting ATPase